MTDRYIYTHTDDDPEDDDSGVEDNSSIEEWENEDGSILDLDRDDFLSDDSDSMRDLDFDPDILERARRNDLDHEDEVEGPYFDDLYLDRFLDDPEEDEEPRVVEEDNENA